MKSIAIDDQGLSGTGMGVNSPKVSVLGLSISDKHYRSWRIRLYFYALMANRNIDGLSRPRCLAVGEPWKLRRIRSCKRWPLET